MSDNGKGSWRSLIMGVLGVVMASILVGIFTPFGEWIRDLISPTSAVVEGEVQKNGKAVMRAEVILDERPPKRTDGTGNFFFEKVPTGSHRIDCSVTENGRLLYKLDKNFFIQKGDKYKKLEVIELNNVEPQSPVPVSKGLPGEGDLMGKPNPDFVGEKLSFTKQKSSLLDYEVELVYHATVIPPEGRRLGFESNTRTFTIWVGGNEQVLSHIERVTYYLHPTFNPSVITRYSFEDKFTLSLTAWGEFELKAKVYFKEGQVKDLSKFLSF